MMRWFETGGWWDGGRPSRAVAAGDRLDGGRASVAAGAGVAQAPLPWRAVPAAVGLPAARPARGRPGGAAAAGPGAPRRRRGQAAAREVAGARRGAGAAAAAGQGRPAMSLIPAATPPTLPVAVARWRRARMVLT